MTAQEITALAREIAAACDAGAGGLHAPPCGCGHSAAAAAAPRARRAELAAMIDQTLVRPDASEAELRRFLASARPAGFHAVCVQPSRVAAAVRELRGTSTRVAAVVGFPHGATMTPVKRLEAETAIRLGATEIDMTANVGAVLSDDLDAVFTDIKAVAAVTARYGAVLKVILETPRLDRRRKIHACVVSKLAGADFVSTATGFEGAFADARDVAAMHRVVGGALGVKAAGGIRTYAELQSMLQAGATRIGAGRGLEILAESGAA